MKPEEITAENWVEVLEEYLNSEQEALTASVREHLSIEGQSILRALRDELPRYTPTVPTVQEA